MSIFGALSRVGIEVNGPGGIIRLTSPVQIIGGIVANAAGGKIFYVDGVNGLDTRNGQTPTTAKKTLAAAYALTTSGNHDVVCIIGGATGTLIVDQLVWANSYTHLIGIAAPTPNSRARISNSGNSTSTNALLKITGQGSIFANFRIYQASTVANCHAIEVTGDRNYFHNVNIQGQLVTASAQGANASSLFLNGAEEFRFERCIIGQVTGVARTAGSPLKLDGSCGKGDFIDCDFESYSETVGAEIIKYVDTAAVDRAIIFRSCLFYNFSVNRSIVLNEVVDTPSSPQTHDLIFIQPTLVGVKEIDQSAYAWVTGPVSTAGTAGSGQSGVAVHPS